MRAIAPGLILLGLWAVPSLAAPAQELGLETVIRSALDRDSKVAHADIRLKQARAKLLEAQGVFDWHASARAGWTRLYFPRVETVGGERVLTDDLDNTSSEMVQGGVRKLFRSGISVQPGITFYPGTSASQAQTFGLTRPVPSINLDVPLLHSFDSNNLEAAEERAARDEVVGGEFGRQAALQQAAVDGAQTYWRCLAAQEEVQILSADHDEAQAYLESLHKLALAGRIEPSVLERAEARQAGKEANLAKLRDAESGCRADLAVLLNQDSGMALPTLAAAFPGMDMLAPGAGTLQDEALAELAGRNRPDLRALEQYAAAASERVAGARTGLDPKIDLSLDPNGVFLTLSKSLGDKAEQGAVAAAGAAQSEARLNVTELRDQIRRDISRGLSALRGSLATLAALRRSDQSLKAIVQDAKRAVQNGVMDPEQLRTLQSESADTAVQLTEAELDTALNLAALRLVTGTVVVDGAAAPSRNADLFRSLQFR